MTEFQTELASLTAMARAPGFKEESWHEAKRLDAHESGLWSGIAAALVADVAPLARQNKK